MTSQLTAPTWWPNLDIADKSCKVYVQLYEGCGCIHQDLVPLTIHHKECYLWTLSKAGKMTETKYHEHLSKRACDESEIIHQLFDGPCQRCSTKPQLLIGSRNSVRRLGHKFQAALEVSDRKPPRQKFLTGEKPPTRDQDEIERRKQAWAAGNEIHAALVERKIEARRQQRRDSYNAYLTAKSVEEINNGVNPDDRFYTFNFTGGPGGSLLIAAEPGTPASPCQYCGSITKALNGPPEQLPCGCLVHRECATNQFMLAAYGVGQQKARCTCRREYNLLRLHNNFEDDAYPPQST